jgi:hypothetical protein
MSLRSLLMLTAVIPLLACETLAPATGRRSQPGTPGLSRTAIDVQTGPEALSRFVVAVEPQFGGGECRTQPAPPIPGLPPGSRFVQVFYPRQQTAETMSAVALDPDGRMLQYQEVRGVRTSSNPDLRQAVDEMAGMPSTSITLDFVNGRAMVVNTGGGTPNAGVRTTLADFEADARFRDVRQRAERVLTFCHVR